MQIAPKLLELSSRNLYKLVARNLSEKVPRILYVSNPIDQLKTKYRLALLKLTWDPEFDEKEFKRGASKVASKSFELL